MIVAMQTNATDEQIQNVVERMVEIGFNVHRTTGTMQTILAGVGTPGQFDHKDFELFAVQTHFFRNGISQMLDPITNINDRQRFKSAHDGTIVRLQPLREEIPDVL